METAEDSVDEVTTKRELRLDDAEGPPLILAGGATHPGRMRMRNEDAFEIVAECGLAMLADGLGGHPAGDIASRMAVQEVGEYVRELDLDPTQPDASDPGAAPRATMDFMSLAVLHANREIHFAGLRYPVCAGMGATFVSLLLVRGFAIFAHVGDSRVYRLRAGELTRLTEDHSRAAEYLRAHGTQADPAITRRHEGTLTRCLGARSEVMVDVGYDHHLPGDAYLLCSDGLWSVVPESTLARILTETVDPGQAAEQMILEANRAGGPDNVTAVIVYAVADLSLPSS
ncbi:MAG: protein phosphatase 2C domain-containing protein [Polyangiaceae bacterium]